MSVAVPVCCGSRVAASFWEDRPCCTAPSAQLRQGSNSFPGAQSSLLVPLVLSILSKIVSSSESLF